jgi:hypothetical protein
MGSEHLEQLKQRVTGRGAGLYLGAMKMIAERLVPEERVVAAATGMLTKATQNAVVVCATDRRLIVAGKLMLLRELHEFPYERINSIDLGGLGGLGGLGSLTLRINAGGAGIEVRLFATDQAERLVDVVRESSITRRPSCFDECESTPGCARRSSR